MQFKLATAGRRLAIEDIEKLSIEFDQCFICGRGLDVLDSKRQGIGPKCRGKISGPVALPLASELKGVDAMAGYSAREEYDGEDVGPGGVVYDSALALAEQWVATFGGDVATNMRHILEDTDGERALSMREILADA
jgi:hypothetical protein